MKHLQMDFFQYTAILGFVIVTAVLSVATADEDVDLRLASMPQAIVLYLAGGLVTITGIMSHFSWRLPVRMSSTAREDLTKPGVFVVMEDIVAVDGGGGDEFRRALRDRYDASETFRRMLTQLNWFWGVGSVAVAVVTTVVVYVVNDLNVVFATGEFDEVRCFDCTNLRIGWCLPWGWAGFAALLTTLRVKQMLRLERTQFE